MSEGDPDPNVGEDEDDTVSDDEQTDHPETAGENPEESQSDPDQRDTEPEHESSSEDDLRATADASDETDTEEATAEASDEDASDEQADVQDDEPADDDNGGDAADDATAENEADDQDDEPAGDEDAGDAVDDATAEDDSDVQDDETASDDDGAGEEDDRTVDEDDEDDSDAATAGDAPSGPGEEPDDDAPASDDESTDQERSFEEESEADESDRTLDDSPEFGEYDPEEDGVPGADTDGEVEADEADSSRSVTSGLLDEGAPDDQEMPLTEHIEEMVKRLAVVIVVMALVSAVVIPLADRLINFLWYSFLPGPPTECVQSAAAIPENLTSVNATGANVTAGNATAGNGTVANASSVIGGSGEAACPRLYHPLALVFARLKMASLAGFVIALPVFVYETYLFMRPGLYPNERRYYLASVPTSLILAGIGLAFAYFLVLPVIFVYFLGYSQPVAEVAFGLTKTFNLILLMMGMFALIFQIPLFVMLAIMMGVTSREWLQDRRLYFWFGFGGIAFIFSPDPTGMAPFIVAATMILLFEGTLLLLRWTGR